jgi:DNA-binding HxlR family transcriptional regulator
VGGGVLERREYSAHPPRCEYVLTDKGTDLCDLLMVMVRFGDRWLAEPASTVC